jgi:hypothetical protein
MGDVLELGVFEEEVDRNLKYSDEDGSNDYDVEDDIYYENNCEKPDVSDDALLGSCEKFFTSNITEEAKENKKRKISQLKEKKEERKKAKDSVSSNDVDAISKSELLKQLCNNIVIPPNSFITDLKGRKVTNTTTYHTIISSTLSKKQLKPENVEDTGCPKILIVCGSAQRACDILKSISDNVKCKVAKLYAKHFKVCSYRISFYLSCLIIHLSIRYMNK